MTQPHLLHTPVWNSITAVCVITLPCGGKTTTVRALHSLMPDGSACMADTSDGFDWCLARNDTLAEQLRAARNDREAGGLIPDKIAIPATTAYLEHEVLGKNRDSRILFWSGYPRSVPQVELLSRFQRFAVVYLDVPESVAEKRCLKRWRETQLHKRRPDDAKTERELLEKFRDRRLPSFRNSTAPAIDFLRNYTICVDGTAPLENQVEYILGRLAEMKTNRRFRKCAEPAPILDGELHDAARASFGNRNHRFHTEIVAGTSRPKPPDARFPVEPSGAHSWQSLTAQTANTPA